MHRPVRIALVLGFLLTAAGCDRGQPSLPDSSSSPAAPSSAAGSPAATPAQATPAQPAANDNPAALAARFDANRAYKDVQTLADPSYQGRHAGTPGEAKGAAYFTEQLKAAGLQPGGDGGTYIQEFPMPVVELDGVPQLQIIGPGTINRDLRLRDDFRPVVSGPFGPGIAEGEGYFAGYGDNISAADVKGKMVVLVPARRQVRDVVADLRRAGAVGLILTSGAQPLLKSEQGSFDADAMPTAQITREGFNTLIRTAGKDPEELRAAAKDNKDLGAFPLGAALRIATNVERRDIKAKNVIGVLPGSGEDVIVVGGHYEEIGPDPDGVVYPAANDNASGSAIVLELARFLHDAGIKPKASVVFVGWSGHEEGLLGSAFYLDHPTLPLERTKAYFNFDTVGQGSGDSVLVQGLDGNLQGVFTEVQSELEAALGKRVGMNASSQREGGSDHVNFRRKGIPIASFEWSGLFASPLHLPTDDAASVDPEKLRTTGQVGALGLLKLIMR